MIDHESRLYDDLRARVAASASSSSRTQMSNFSSFPKFAQRRPSTC